MDISTAVKETLSKENPIFKDLLEKHQVFETRLSELSNLAYPSDEEQVEESLLKKKKLAVKDEIYNIVNEYEKGH
jgi:uncharacterized protein YdcH (DUF465 family)